MRVRVRVRVRLLLQLGLEVGGGICLQPDTLAPSSWHVPWPVQPSSHAIAPQSAVGLVRVRDWVRVRVRVRIRDRVRVIESAVDQPGSHTQLARLAPPSALKV